MRPSFVEIARCPVCRAERSFALEARERDEREVRTGTLTCGACGERRAIEGGIVDLMPPAAPDFVRREAGGLERFAQLMRDSGWDRERVLNLPYEQSGYWYAQATAMHQVLAEVPFAPGERVLDVGSNTCWASAMLAERGLDVVALDIATAELQGLATADLWFAGKEVFFERMLGLMFDVSLATGSVDHVWCSEVLHHNHRANLARTMRELHRVLRPGGRLIAVNETLRALADPKLRPGEDVAEYEGHEHAYVRASYTHAARRAGFAVELLEPWTHAPFTGETFGLSVNVSARDGFKAATSNAIRATPWARRAYLAWKAYVAGGASLWMVATKPG